MGCPGALLSHTARAEGLPRRRDQPLPHHLCTVLCLRGCRARRRRCHHCLHARQRADGLAARRRPRSSAPCRAQGARRRARPPRGLPSSCASGPGAWSPCAGRPALAPPIVIPEPRPRPDLATHRLSVFFSVSNCVLVNIQDALEDPFDGDTADDISLAIFEPSWAFWKSGEEIFRRDIVSEYQKSSSRPAARAA